MIKLGYINDKDRNFLISQDVIKMDISDDANIAVKYNKTGSITTDGYPKAKTTVEFDFLTEAQRADLRSVMLDANYPKIFMRHPAGANQNLNYYGVTGPSSTHVVLYVDSDNADLGYSGTEFLTADYTNIGNTTGYVTKSTAARAYQYIFFKFKTDAFDLDNTYWKRISLLLHNCWCTDNGVGSGYIVDVYNQGQAKWINLLTVPYTLTDSQLYTLGDKVFQSFAIIKARENYTNVTDLTYASNTIYFRMRNLYPRITTVALGLNYVELLIDGWPVSWTNSNSLNYRDEFTGTGFTGTMELQEL